VPEERFSTRFDAELDMRWIKSELNAHKVVNEYDKQILKSFLWLRRLKKCTSSS
jgi:16S rRNA C1402 N4-methylase RsmH